MKARDFTRFHQRGTTLVVPHKRRPAAASPFPGYRVNHAQVIRSNVFNFDMRTQMYVPER